MAVKKSDREKALARASAMREAALEFMTSDKIDREHLGHAIFAANAFGIASAIEKTLADINPKYTDLRADLLLGFAYCALSELAK